MFNDDTFIHEISSHVRNFKKLENSKYNFSCPICGDSHKNKRKARGYLYRNNKGYYVFYCHNCNVFKIFSEFLKELDVELYNRYVFEKYRNSKVFKEEKKYMQFTKPKFYSSELLKGLKRVSSLSPSNKTKKFVVNRKIPNQYHNKMFECPEFKHFVNKIIPNKFTNGSMHFDETRLLIPFIDSDGEVHAFQGRSLDKDSKLKYITIVLDESKPKIYGLDTVNFNDKTFVFEGPIDSMFIPNSIATAGGDLVSCLDGYCKEKLILVYDNEPRSEHTVKKLDKAIGLGYNVCIWPENVQYKDINDMILGGMSPEDVKTIITSNTFNDLNAKLHLVKWRK